MASVRTGFRKVGTIAYQANSQVAPFRIPVEGSFLRWIELELTATLNITNTTSLALIAMHPESLIPTLSVVLNQNVTLKSGRFYDWRTRSYLYNGKLPVQVLDTVAVNATQVKSRVIIPFEMPLSRNPEATALQVGHNDRLELNVTWGDESSLVNSGTKAFTVDPKLEVSVFTVQDNPAPKGLFIEQFSEFSGLGTSALNDQQLQLIASPNKNYHSLLIQTENELASSAGGRTLADWTLSELRLQQTVNNESNDVRGILTGDQMQNSADLRLGSVAGIQTGVYPLLFIPEADGMRSFAYPTGGLSDLRMFVSTTGTPTTDGVIRVLENVWRPFPSR